MAKLTFIIIALMASFSLSFAQSCGKTTTAMRPNRRFDPEGQRIVGGVEARPGSHPWIVSLQSYRSHFCGGTLIRVSDKKEQSDIIVTAAHCVYDGTSSSLEIVAGAHDLYGKANGQQSSKASVVKYYPAYDSQTTENDIAFIKLATPINFTSTTQPACLPVEDETVADNAEATVAGWGLTREGGAYSSNLLMQVGVPTINSKECAASYKKSGIVIDNFSMICAGYKTGGKDACQGDSGGPFVMKNKDGGFTLQGVVSFGIGCARPGMPGVYTRVATYMRWINNNIGYYSDVAKSA